MLTNMTETGHFVYNCHECGIEQTVHVSHEEVQYVAPNDITTPACPQCLERGLSARLSLKTEYTAEQLAPPVIGYNKDGSIASCIKVGAPNLTDIQFHFEDHVDEAGAPYKVRVIDRVIYPPQWLAHHQNLAKQMEAQGKVYTHPAERTSVPAELTPVQLQQVIAHLQAQGLIIKNGE